MPRQTRKCHFKKNTFSLTRHKINQVQTIQALEVKLDNTQETDAHMGTGITVHYVSSSMDGGVSVLPCF